MQLRQRGIRPHFVQSLPQCLRKKPRFRGFVRLFRTLARGEGHVRRLRYVQAIHAGILPFQVVAQGPRWRDVGPLPGDQMIRIGNPLSVLQIAGRPAGMAAIKRTDDPRAGLRQFIQEQGQLFVGQITARRGAAVVPHQGFVDPEGAESGGDEFRCGTLAGAVPRKVKPNCVRGTRPAQMRTETINDGLAGCGPVEEEPQFSVGKMIAEQVCEALHIGDTAPPGAHGKGVGIDADQQSVQLGIWVHKGKELGYGIGGKSTPMEAIKQKMSTEGK